MGSDNRRLWLLRAPFELARPFFAAEGVLAVLYRLCVLHEEGWRDFDEIYEERGRYSTRKLTPKEKADRYAARLAQLNQVVAVGQECLPAVEEEFGAAAVDTPPPTGLGHLYCSYHRFALELGQQALLFVLDAVGLDPSSSFTAEEVSRQIAEAEDDDCLDPGVAAKDIRPLELRLQQELCRAWKQRYPDASAKFKTWGKWSGQTEPPPPPEIDPGYRRPAYARDHCWLDLHLTKKMGPAAIRDWWDGLSQQDRTSICPTAADPVGGDDPQSKRAGREVVKTGLRRAKEERGL